VANSSNEEVWIKDLSGGDVETSVRNLLSSGSVESITHATTSEKGAHFRKGVKDIHDTGGVLSMVGPFMNLDPFVESFERLYDA
jgi:hypothetical protein